jgi:protein tyrosine/serine phosphatase
MKGFFFPSTMTCLSLSFLLLPTITALSDFAATTTRRSPLYNFGPASQRDTVLFSAERPGNPPGKTDPIPDERVVEWIQFMQEKEQNIHTVVALLDDNELVNYKPTGLLTLYRKYGLKCQVQSMNDPRAAHNLFRLFEQAETAQQRVVTHCTGGIGRCGRVAGAWLMHRYQLTPEQASQETLQCARHVGMIRACDPVQLKQWLDTQQLGYS